MKKAAAYILFILLGLAVFVPPAAHARAHSARQSSKYMKQQKKAQKKAQKSQMKAMKNWNKQHHTGQW
jgi:hypothetical protein